MNLAPFIIAPYGRVSSESLVNTATSGLQFFQQNAALANGGYVVAWTDQSHGVGGASGDTSDNAVKAQIYDGSGLRVGTEILVNTTTAGSQFMGSLTGLPSGGFVVTWLDSSALSFSHIKSQLFDAVGHSIGGETLVDTGYAARGTFPQVVPLKHGGFVIAWDGGLGTAAQLFDASGQRIGSELALSSMPSGDRQNTHVVALSDGGFAAVWEDYRMANDGDGVAVKARTFDSAGNATSSEVVVNTAIAGDQMHAQVAALANGGFAVTWDDLSIGVGGAGGDTSNYAIKAQVFSNVGVRLGGELLVNTATASTQAEPQIAALDTGGFAITWEDFSQGVGGAPGDTSHYAIKAQIFDDAGARAGGEILANSATSSDQYRPSIAPLSHGAFIIAWSDYSHGVGGTPGDSSQSGIKAQVFGSTGAKLGPELLANSATQSYQIDPRPSVLTGGEFVLTWTDSSNGVGGATGDSDQAIKAQLYGLGSLSATERVPLNLKTAGFSVGDPDLSNVPLTLTVSAAYGVLHLAPGSSGVSIQSGNDTGSVVVSGLEAQLDALLNSDPTSIFTYTANTYAPPSQTTLTVDINDNGSGGGPALTATTDLKIFIAAINDAPTSISTSGALSVDEASLNGAPVGDFLGVDPDGDSLTWSLTNDAGGRFKISSTGQLQVADGVSIDFEQAISHQVIVRATDPQGLFLESSVNVTVNDVSPETVAGDARNNTFVGGPGNDVFSGGPGDDVFQGGGGSDTLFGGPGADSFVYKAALDAVLNSGETIVSFETGIDHIDLSAVAATAIAIVLGASPRVYASTLNGTMEMFVIGAIEGPDIVTNGVGLTILGSFYDIPVIGSAYNDTLFGEDGADDLFGGLGVDILFGGAGGDLFHYISATDSIAGASDLIGDFASGSDGIDLAGPAPTAIAIMQQGGNSLIFANTPGGAMQIGVLGTVQGSDLITGGIGVNIQGGPASTLLFGTAFNDTLFGEDGFDLLVGGNGADVLFGGAGVDSFRYLSATDSTAAAGDLIADFQTGVDRIDLTGTGVTAVGIAGNIVFGSGPGGIAMQIGVLGTVSLSDIVIGSPAPAPLIAETSHAIHGMDGSMF